MMRIFALARKAIWVRKRFSLLFILNTALGLSGLLIVDATRKSIQSISSSQSRALLTGDLGITSRRALSSSEELLISQTLPSATQTSQFIETLSMLSTLHSSSGVVKPQSRLVQIRAIDNAYPLHGQIRLRNAGRIRGEEHENFKGLWISSDLATQLSLKIGDQVKIGDLAVVIEDILDEDLPSGVGFSSLSPRVYMALEKLKTSTFVQRGSTAIYSSIYSLPEKHDSEHFVQLLNRSLTDPMLQVTSHRQTGSISGRLIAYLTDHLGLLAIVTLCLSGIASTFLLRNLIESQIQDLATLRSIGFTQLQTATLILSEILMLNFLSIWPAYALVRAGVPFLNQEINRLSTFSVPLSVPSTTLIWGISLSLGLAVLFSLPHLARILKMKPSSLMREEHSRFDFSGSHRAHRWAWLFYLPSGLALWMLSVLEAHSYVVGSVFILGLSLSSIFILGVGWILIRGAHLGIFRHWFASRFAILQIRRIPLSSMTVVLALALTSSLINLIPQLKNSLESELTVNQVERPNLFLFDIQEEQLLDLTTFISSKGHSLRSISPLVRARLENVNNQVFGKIQLRSDMTREEEESVRSRNRGFNLSYKVHLAPPLGDSPVASPSVVKSVNTLNASEIILQGRPFQDFRENSVPEISLEEKFADRLGLKIGDLLQFDVQGVSVEGRIVNLRKVRWTSFEPNFFIIFQDGVLNEAPKTYLASLGHLTSSSKSQMLQFLSEKFPNVSVVDVDGTVSQLIKLTESISSSVNLMSLLTILTGLFVVLAISLQRFENQIWHYNLLKILGLNEQGLRNVTLCEFGALGLFASSLGAVTGLLTSYLISRFVFNSLFRPVLDIGVISVVVLTGFSVLISQISLTRIVLSKPQRFLQAP